MEVQDLEQYLDIDIMEALENRFMDSQELYGRFLKKFAAEEREAALGQAFAGGDQQELLRQAHNLKGVAANLGLCGLAAKCQDLVAMLRSGNQDKAELTELYGTMLQEYVGTKAVLKRLD